MPVQRVGIRKTRSFFSTMQEGQLDRLLQSMAENGIAQPDWLQEAVRENRASVMVQLPLPISLLVALGAWNRFCACDMKRSLYKGWMLGACPLLWQACQLPCMRMPELEEVENLMHADTAAQFAEDLQEVYAKACDLVGDDLGPEAASKMHKLAAALQNHVSGMRSSYRNHAEVLNAGKDAYNAYYLLHCFLLCDLLRADSSLGEAVRYACQIALPKHVQDVVLLMLDDGNRPVPSAATVSRLRLKVDVAWMLLARKKMEDLLRDGLVVHCMVDSSPQGGHDYELLHVTFLAKHDLNHFHVEVCALEALKKLSIAERVDKIDNERRIMDHMRRYLQMCTPPPVLLGMGKHRSGLQMKFHAAMHAAYLIAGPGKNLEKFISSVWTWVSDLGTEAGFSHIGKMNLRELFPYIMESEDQANPSLHEEVDLAGENVAPLHREPFVSCEGSVSIPGVLHILHNCFLSLGGAMQEFSPTVGLLKEVATLLSQPESKERLLNTCFTGPLGEALAADVKAFSGQVYEERWGTVSDCILQLLPCENSLRHAWNMDSFLMSSRAEGEQGQRPGTVSVEKANEAITSHVFWAYLEMLSLFATLQSRLISWVEGCPCHWEILHSGADIPHDLKALWTSCPLKGRRAADIASGEFLRLVQESFGWLS